MCKENPIIAFALNQAGIQKRIVRHSPVPSAEQEAKAAGQHYCRWRRHGCEMARIFAWQFNLTTRTLQCSEVLNFIFKTGPDFKPTLGSIRRFFPRASWGLLSDTIRRAIREQVPFELELPMKSGNNPSLWTRISGAVRSENGQLVWIEGSVQDITDQQNAQLAIAEEHRILHNLLELSLNGYWDWRVQEDQAVFSDAYLAMFGYSPGELPGSLETWKSLVYKEDMQLGLDPLQKHFGSRGSHPFRFEARYHHKSGSTVWVLCIGVVIEWDPDGRPLRMIGCHIDISERKAAEIAHAQSEERMRLALAGANDGWWDMNIETGEIFFSPRWWSMLGYQPDEIAINQPSMFELLHPECRRSGEEVFTALLAGTIDTVDKEFLLRHRDGSFVPILVRARMQRDSNGKPLRISGTNTDLTERKMAEAARILAEENLEAAALEERRELASEIHDGAGQLLTAISLKAKRLHDLADSDANLQLQASELLKLVSEAQSRIRAISHGFEWQDVGRSNLISAIRHLVDSCAEGFGIFVNYEGPEKIEARSDRDALNVFLIVQEAVLNAKRHGHASRLVVSVQVISSYWIFRITDNGQGFPFDPGREKSFGMGIRGMQKRASECGGNLKFQSSPGKGTVVTLTLSWIKERMRSEDGNPAPCR